MSYFRSIWLTLSFGACLQTSTTIIKVSTTKYHGAIFKEKKKKSWLDEYGSALLCKADCCMVRCFYLIPFIRHLSIDLTLHRSDFKDTWVARLDPSLKCAQLSYTFSTVLAAHSPHQVVSTLGHSALQPNSRHALWYRGISSRRTWSISGSSTRHKVVLGKDRIDMD